MGSTAMTVDPVYLLSGFFALVLLSFSYAFHFDLLYVDLIQVLRYSLYGLLTAQACMYRTRFPKDPITTRLGVFSLW